MKSCSFFGHRQYGYQEYRERIKAIIVELIEKYKVTQFYSGGRGAFDGICSDIVGELRATYPHVKNTLVYSYMPKKDEYGLPKKYTDSVYLLEDRVPPRLAILKTNEKMVDKADFILSGVRYSWGGAATAQAYALQKKKKVITIFAGERKQG
ncbi:MAG: hypothetical protein IKA20_06175 [Clostridia bacterium]|nr:hypothetical protein [Clostridia bacterium]